MKGVFQRRQLFVHPVQYWFVITTLLYFACLLLTLYAVVFLPMAQPLYDSTISWEQRADIAAQFLELNGRIWPWLIITFLVLLLHSLYFMHRIAGPLYRFTALFRSIGTGQLHQRARLRKHDYLHREAQALNSMLDHFENKIQAVNMQSALVIEAYDAVARQIHEQTSDRVTPALQMLDKEMRRFKTCLAECELQTKQSLAQQCSERTESSTSQSPNAMKAA